MALVVVALFTLLPLALLVADLVRPRRDPDRHAGPARTPRPDRGNPLARPAVSRADFFGDRPRRAA